MATYLYLLLFTANSHYDTWEQAVDFCMALPEPCLNIEKDGDNYVAIYERPFWK